MEQETKISLYDFVSKFSGEIKTSIVGEIVRDY